MFPSRPRFLLLLLLLIPHGAVAQEFRALWADTFHAGLRNGTETTALVAAARAANCNAIVAEVRKRGDAYYRNGLEPMATDINDPSLTFDPLADLIQKAHTGTPRIEVHAWIVTYNIWSNQNTPPTQPSHPYNLHPDWLSRDNTGATWAGDTPTSGTYQFDQGHPAVQQHTFDVVMDIINRYNVDGIHFDYVRYSDYHSRGGNQPWGYNPVAVRSLQNANRAPPPRHCRPTRPGCNGGAIRSPALVRKVYLNAWASKPNVRVSASLITYSNPPASLSLPSWQSTEPYSRVLQDWRGWMEEGILDLACPMIYRNEATTAGFGGWSDFAKDSQYNRAAASGMGWYLNSVSNTITQIKIARRLSPNGHSGVGVVGYSYAVPNSGTVTQAQMWKALTDDAAAETYDPGGTPVFAAAATVPSMPWKTSAAKGHLMGFVRDGTTGPILDGATVLLTGPVSRTLLSDATGFFGAADLPVGTYTMKITVPGFRPLTKTVTVTGAQVAQPVAQLEIVPFLVTSVIRDSAGTTLTITWNSVPGRTYTIQAATTLPQWTTTVATALPASGTTTTYVWNIPTASRAGAYLRVVQE